MEEINKEVNNTFLKIKSELENLAGGHTEITITITPDGSPMALAFFDIDKTLADLRDIHGRAIKALFKEVFDREFEGIEEIYFQGFKLGNSIREFDRMNGIYKSGYKEWINPDIYIKERLDIQKKEIDSEGNDDYKIAKMYLDRYVEIASSIADQIYENNPEYFESAKIKPVIAVAKLYKTLGIPMCGMTANGRIFVETIAKYLGLADLFIDIATDEDMVGGGKEIIIPKLISKIESKGIKVPKEKMVIVGDSLSGDIGSGYKYEHDKKEIFIKGILVLKDNNELINIKNQIARNENLKKIIKNTRAEALIVDNVRTDKNGVPILFTNSFGILVKL